YNVTAIQYDVAGNPSQAVQFGNTGAVVIDGTDSPNHGDNFGPGGTNEGAWLYMQDVLNVVLPNITKTTTNTAAKTFVVLGAHPELVTGSGGPGFVTSAIVSAFAQSNLPRNGWNIVFVEGANNLNTYLSGGVAQTIDSTGKPLGTIALAQTGFI